MWVSGPPKSCGECTSTAVPRITQEIWEASHEVVVGHAVCDACQATHGFTRKLTKAEAKVPQQHHQPIQQQLRKDGPMFSPDTPMTLQDVTFTTEVVDDETRRVVVCTFAVSPFTGAQAEALNVRTLLFDASGQPKAAIETVVLNVSVPLQRLAFAMAPDQSERRITFPAVQIDPKVRVKIKRDRESPVCEATLKASFRYPAADELLYVANGVNDTHYLTFEPEQGDLLTKEAETAATPPRRTRGKTNEATDGKPAEATH